MKKLIFCLFAIALATTLSAQTISKGDYFTCSLNGKNTYTIGEGTNTFECFVHGTYDGNFYYYQQAAGGWKSFNPDPANLTKFTMPKIGEEVYVLKQEPDVKESQKQGKWIFVYRAKKGILKAYGAGAYDTYKLGVQVEITDGQGNPSIEAFNHFATKSELAKLGWAVGAPVTTVTDADLRKIEASIYAAINEARANPAGFANRIPASDDTAKEAIAFLKNMAKSSHQFKALHRKKGMDKAAREHATEHAADGNVGHKGTSQDCSGTPYYLSCRLNRHGKVSGLTGENIFGGGAQIVSGTGTVLALIQDHNVPTRGHRAAFFDTYGNNLTADKKNVKDFMCAYTTVGVGCAYDQKSGNISCVMDFADDYKDK